MKNDSAIILSFQKVFGDDIRIYYIIVFNVPVSDSNKCKRRLVMNHETFYPLNNFQG